VQQLMPMAKIVILEQGGNNTVQDNAHVGMKMVGHTAIANVARREPRRIILRLVTPSTGL